MSQRRTTHLLEYRWNGLKPGYGLSACGYTLPMNRFVEDKPMCLSCRKVEASRG